MTVRTRFAPSPTGFLHLGGARTALFNWLYSRKLGGQFILRVEDTDAARSTDESLHIILDGLRWLGLDWDEGPDAGGDFGPYFQSQRGEIYKRYLSRLEASGAVYEDGGAIRFRVPDREIAVDDVICGRVAMNLREQGSRRYDETTKQEVENNPDIVIRRPDGSFIFHFVNVVDDIEMGITHVIRGEDHLSNTPKHIALYEAFEAQLPVFAHIPLVLNKDGSKMSKRDDGSLMHQYIESGYLPSSVLNYMALLGWSAGEDREIYLSLNDLVEEFDITGINKSNSKFDPDKCRWINAEHIRSLSPEAFAEASQPFLKKAGIDLNDCRIELALPLARERSEVLTDVPTVLMPIFADDLIYDPESVNKVTAKGDAAEVILALASFLAKNETWESDSIKTSIQRAAESLGAKLGSLMLPCRVAATGSTSGADLLPMLELIGKERTVSRLQGFVQRFVP